MSGLDRRNLFLEVAHCPDEDYRWRRLTALLDQARAPGHRLRRHPPRRRGAGRAADRGRLRRGLLPRRHGRRRPRAAARGLHRRQGRHHGRHVGVRHGHRQGRTSAGSRTSPCPTRRTATSRRSAGPAATASRPGRCCSGAPRTRRSSGSSPAAAPDLVELRELAAALRAGPQTKTALQATDRSGPAQARPAAGPAGAGRRGRRRHRQQDGRSRVFAPLPAAAAEAAVAEHERQQVVQRSRTDMMRAFAETQRLPHADPAGLLRRGADQALRALRQLRRRRGRRDRRRVATNRSPCTARSGTPSGAPAW